MLIEAGQICLFIYFLLTSFNNTGNKTMMKKYNITGQKDAQKKKKNRKKRKMADVHCKGEKKILAFLSVRKIL